MNYHAIPCGHVSEAYRPRMSHPQNQEIIARAALKNVPGSEKVLNEIFTKEIQQPVIRKVETQTYYTGFDKPH